MRNIIADSTRGKKTCFSLKKLKPKKMLKSRLNILRKFISKKSSDTLISLNYLKLMGVLNPAFCKVYIKFLLSGFTYYKRKLKTKFFVLNSLIGNNRNRLSKNNLFLNCSRG
jgi:hypothetical protein